MKLFDSEWKVMEVLWQEDDLTAKEISLRPVGISVRYKTETGLK